MTLGHFNGSFSNKSWKNNWMDSLIICAWLTKTTWNWILVMRIVFIFLIGFSTWNLVFTNVYKLFEWQHNWVRIKYRYLYVSRNICSMYRIPLSVDHRWLRLVQLWDPSGRLQDDPERGSRHDGDLNCPSLEESGLLISWGSVILRRSLQDSDVSWTIFHGLTDLLFCNVSARFRGF